MFRYGCRSRRGRGPILRVMQDNTVDVASDSCAVRGRPCTSHGVVDCVGVVFWVVVAPAGVLSCGCLFATQRKCTAIVMNLSCKDRAYEERMDM